MFANNKIIILSHYLYTNDSAFPNHVISAMNQRSYHFVPFNFHTGMALRYLSLTVQLAFLLDLSYFLSLDSWLTIQVYRWIKWLMMVRPTNNIIYLYFESMLDVRYFLSLRPCLFSVDKLYTIFGSVSL